MQRISQDVSATMQFNSGSVDCLQQDLTSAKNQSSQDVLETIQLNSGSVDGLQKHSTSASNRNSQDGLQELNNLLADLHNLLCEYRNSERGQGLTSERIQQFSQFIADESLTGTQCGVCLEFIEVGRRIMRLDCDGQHVFCQDCVDKWFVDHNTCPKCRQIF